MSTVSELGPARFGALETAAVARRASTPRPARARRRPARTRQRAGRLTGTRSRSSTRRRMCRRLRPSQTPNAGEERPIRCSRTSGANGGAARTAAPGRGAADNSPSRGAAPRLPRRLTLFTLGLDARPVPFDEAEAEAQKQRERERKRHMLDPARAASAGHGADILEGTQTGGVGLRRIASCFAFAAVNVAVETASNGARGAALSGDAGEAAGFADALPHGSQLA